MLETKCVGVNFEMLVTVFAVFVTNILFFPTDFSNYIEALEIISN